MSLLGPILGSKNSVSYSGLGNFGASAHVRKKEIKKAHRSFDLCALVLGLSISVSTRSRR